ncbi:cyclin-d3-3 [Phtheirospermum japonicum]|uniref:Cyclin-d3-3 n=1 Tax=Phtheirospermum japonicum TaxID=374723 RepID=A0A830CWF7_9LAMI|nr:cyclin-d3-3 [Phtheirospermum japonicum]
MLSVIGYYGFSALTAVLAVNYYDRFITSLCFQKDKPWMSQLASVACLSIAAKVEETQVTFLLDLQEKIDDYHKLIVGAMMDDLSRKSCLKHKYSSIPNSPSGVIDAYFSSDSSVDLWAV